MQYLRPLSEFMRDEELPIKFLTIKKEHTSTDIKDDESSQEILEDDYEYIIPTKVNDQDEE